MKRFIRRDKASEPANIRFGVKMLNPIESKQVPQVIRKTRASRPRVKTGCGICRKRRVKCDEARPACGGCLRSGWKCDGYPAPKADALTLAALSGSRTSLNISSYSIPFQVPGTKREREVLHYFCAQAATDLSGFVSSEFWTSTVLQISHHEPVIRQVLLALSSLHLDYISSDLSGSQVASAFTMQQYGKGLKNLRKRPENSSPDNVRVALICSILFYSFESMLGNSQSALHQLGGGLALLKSLQGSGNSRMVQYDAISDVFARLDMQATMFDDSQLPTLTLTTDSERTSKPMESSDLPFSNLEAAQRELSKLQNWLFHLLITNVTYKSMPVECVPRTVLLEKSNLEQQIRTWYKKFSPPVPWSQPTASVSSSGKSILLIQYYVSRMLLASNFPENRSVFGACPNPLAEKAVEMAENVLLHAQHTSSSAKTMQNPRRIFSAESGVIAPLALIIIKCADPSVVQRATRILTLLRRQEGLYDTTSLLAVAQHLNSIKDSRLDLPELKDAPLSLEYLALDFVNGAQAGMETENKLIPPTILPTPG